MVASWKKIFQHFDANRKFIGMGWVLGFLSFLKSDNWAIRFFLKSTNTFGYVMVKIWPESILVKIRWLEEKSNGSVTWPEKTQKTQNPTHDPSLKIWRCFSLSSSPDAEMHHRYFYDSIEKYGMGIGNVWNKYFLRPIFIFEIGYVLFVNCTT